MQYIYIVNMFWAKNRLGNDTTDDCRGSLARCHGCKMAYVICDLQNRFLNYMKMCDY